MENLDQTNVQDRSEDFLIRETFQENNNTKKSVQETKVLSLNRSQSLGQPNDESQASYAREGVSFDMNYARPIVSSIRDEVISQDISQSSGQVQEANIQVDARNLNLEEKKQKLKNILESSAKFTIRKALLVGFLLFSESFFLSPNVEEIFSLMREVFIICYLSLAAYLMDNIFNAKCCDGIIPWKKTENFFDTLDAINLILFLVFIDLRLNNLNIQMIYVFILPLGCFIVYFWQSRAPSVFKKIETIIRLLYALQILLIGAKMDGELDWPWPGIFCFIWIYFLMLALFSLFSILMLIFAIIHALFHLDFSPNMGPFTQISGLMWLTLYAGLEVVAFVGFLGFPFVLDLQKKEANDLLQSISLLLKCFSSLLVLISLLTYRRLVEFLTRFNAYESEYKIQLGIPLSENDSARIVTETKDTYLIKLSSTYFLPLNKGLLLKSKHHLNRLRTLMKEARKKRLKKKSKKPKVIRPKKSDKEKFFSIKRFNKNKKEPEKNFEIQEKDIDAVEKVKSNLQEPKDNNISLFRNTIKIDHPQTERRVSKCYSDTQNRQNRVCVTEGDRTFTLESQTAKEANENLCYICFSNVPNGVIAECGHGGICVECAVQTIKVQGQCMECRKKATGIIKINPTSEFDDIVKGFETITFHE